MRFPIHARGGTSRCRIFKWVLSLEAGQQLRDQFRLHRHCERRGLVAVAQQAVEKWRKVGDAALEIQRSHVVIVKEASADFGRTDDRGRPTPWKALQVSDEFFDRPAAPHGPPASRRQGREKSPASGGRGSPETGLGRCARIRGSASAPASRSRCAPQGDLTLAAMVPQELVLGRHHTCGLGDHLANVRKPFQRFFVGQKIRGGMIVRGLDPLTDEDGEPARFGEELDMFAEYAAVPPEHFDLVGHALGRIDLPAVVPEREIIALRRLVMEHQEVADIDIFLDRLGIEAIDRQRVELA